MKRELKITRDGSHTIFVPELNEHYHSVNGAVSESMHVFNRHGLDFVKQKTGRLRILEVGLGTGLNACLTFAHAGESEIHYTALEPFPLENIVLDELNYGAWIDRKLFAALHDAVWNVSRPVAGNHSGSFKKLKISIEDFRTDEKFNLVYFDAFAAHVHPELWTEKIFSKIFQMLDKGGALVTYSAKGSVKRALKSCGFVVETLPGAPGKREMVRASRPRQSSD